MMNHSESAPMPAPVIASIPGRMLVIDDEPAELQLLTDYLQDYDFAISLASTGAEGLARACREKPDLVILDLHMPPPDGFAVLEQLKASPATEAIPVLVLSGRSDVDSRVRSFALGAADYIPKPVHEAELRARITAHLNNAQLRVALQRRLRAYEARFGELQPAPADARPSTPQREVAQLMRVRQILLERLAEPPSLPELARLVGTNQPRLSRGFRALFGTTVFGFLREARLQRARQLLLETDWPVKTIALEVGYRNTGDLTRSVRDRFGMTPTALREHG